MSVTPTYTEINVIGNYAATAKSTVTVTDGQGNPVSDACVEFKLYNYAEFYTVARKQSDEEGKASLTAGKRRHAGMGLQKTESSAMPKLSFGKDHELTVKMDKTVGDGHAVDFETCAATRKMRSYRRLRPNSVRRTTAAWFMKIPSATLMCLCS